MKISVQYWRYEDGETCPNPTLPDGQGRLNPPPRGWYCWVYPDDDNLFKDWMDINCPTAQCTLRFNSGNPMWTVHITQEKEATLFSLTWL